MTTELEQALEKMDLKLTARYVGENTREGWGADHDTWRVQVRRGQRAFTTDYSAGFGHRLNDKPQAPKLADVLACLLSDASSGAESFEDFCSNLGYDSDSRKALATWRSCRRTAAAFDRLLGAETLEFLIGLEH